MAIINSNSPGKAEAYESLYLICQAAQQIAQLANVPTWVFTKINKVAEITASAVHNLTGPETAKAYRYESKHIHMERNLTQLEAQVQPFQKEYSSAALSDPGRIVCVLLPGQL